MKKTILFMLLSIGFLALTGCSLQKSSDQTATTIEQSASIEPTENEQETKASETLESNDTTAATSGQSEINLGAFQATGLNNEVITPSIFSDYDLTLVNVFATWCPPCLAEMPDLESISQDMSDQSIQVIGIVLDINETNKSDPDSIAVLQEVVDQTGVTYPILIPDETLSAFLSDVEYVPTTFFVDKNGNIVGESYAGARSKNQWLSVIQSEQANIGKQS